MIFVITCQGFKTGGIVCQWACVRLWGIFNKKGFVTVGII